MTEAQNSRQDTPVETTRDPLATRATISPATTASGAGAVSTEEKSRPRPWVLWPSVGTIAVVVLVALLIPETLSEILSDLNATVVRSVGWYYVAIVLGFLVLCLWLMAGRFGDVKLGREDTEAEYNLVSWFAMLFAAGMGIGLVFWGVAEPLTYFENPKPGVEGSPELLASRAMSQTFLHWGLHAWAIYAVVGLSVAYAIHRRGFPVSIRWALYPLLGERVKGAVGDVIDTFAVIGTVFGVATSLGMGVAQIASGLHYLGVGDGGLATQRIAIVLAASAAAFSAASGVSRGIQYLSNINLGIAGFLLISVLALGPSLFIMNELIQAIGSYIQNFIGLSFSTLAFQGEAGAQWMSSWTTYYWGWWISWSPFVGLFIARISKGRTVREFIAGVLLVPTMVTMIWFAVLGGSALWEQIFGTGSLTDAKGNVDTTLALFHLLETYPGTRILSGLFIILLLVFFITSADSGGFVVAMISAGGHPNPPRWLRILWVASSATIAFVLLDVGGGLSALQTFAILVAVPFSIVMLMMCLSLVRTARWEVRSHETLTRLADREQMVEHMKTVATAAVDTRLEDLSDDAASSRRPVLAVRSTLTGVFGSDARNERRSRRNHPAASPEVVEAEAGELGETGGDGSERSASERSGLPRILRRGRHQRD